MPQYDHTPAKSGRNARMGLRLEQATERSLTKRPLHGKWKKTGKTVFTQQRLSRNSTNVVYLVHSIKCNLLYVGSTTTEFKVRFRNHKSSMKTNKKTCEVAIHFNKTAHTFADFTFQCIDQIRTSTNHDTDKLLITKEAYWSAQLFWLAPFGLNKRQKFHSKNRIHCT